MDAGRSRRYTSALSPCGGTGRRTRLKIVRRKAWGFDSLHGHHDKFIFTYNILQPCCDIDLGIELGIAL
jgi:hypothetical protein